MAAKSLTANKKKSNKMNLLASLKAADVFCYICRGILIEPVTVPCNHVFCLKCFEASIMETSYSCPLCRRRISNWVRSAKKCDKLLNYELWEQIKVQYQEEVASKLAGRDDGLDERLQEEFKNEPIISPDGVIGEEYSRLVHSHEEELRIQREKEERQSQELIDRLLKEQAEAEEKANLEAVLRLRNSADKLRSLTRKQCGSKVVASTSSSSSSSRKKSVTSQKAVVGPMDQHIMRLTLAEEGSKPRASVSDGRSDSSDSGDSIGSELHHFKPIRVVPKTPPKDGIALEHTVKKITPVKLFVDNSVNLAIRMMEKNRSIHSTFSAFRGRATDPDDGCETPKKKAKMLASEAPDSGVLKEINLDENSDSNSVGKSETDGKTQEELRIPKLGPSLLGEENLSGLEELFDREEQQRLEERLLQEKADRELALRLSREWGQTYELRPTRLPRSCRVGARQTTLLESVVTRRKK